MNINKRIFFVIVTCLIAGCFMISLLPKDTGRVDSINVLRIGAGDDIGGWMLKQIVEISRETGNSERIVNSDFITEAYEFQDC